MVTGIAAYALLMPGDLKFKLDVMGFGVCHQIHTHSFTIGGHQLPLCARCTGIYLGALATLFLLTRLKKRAVRLPSGTAAGALALFFLVMVADGLNSTLQTFGANLWDSNNVLRLITGALAGIAVAACFYPFFNMTVWSRHTMSMDRVVSRPLELALYLGAAGLLLAAVLLGSDWLYYPLAIMSIGGMFALLTMAGTMLVLIAGRREMQVRAPRDLVTPLLAGVIVGLAMLTLLAWGRESMAPVIAANNTFGLPLVPGLP
jgi:uncharacterized membrane protein